MDATADQIANFDNNQEAFQDGLPGIHGTWAQPGVHCEACHGPGGNHVVSMSADDITVALTDAPDELPGKRCGECHTRDAQNRIAASGSPGSIFIRHHEQYDELLASPHAELGCVACHDPHEPTRFAPELGIIRQCLDCHPDYTIDRPSMANLDCIDCHMPAAGKSGITYNDRMGDVKTHIFRITTEPIGAEDPGGMFYNDPADDGLVTRGHLTLDFACLGCHDGNFAGGGAHLIAEVDQALADVAELIHTSAR